MLKFREIWAFVLQKNEIKNLASWYRSRPVPCPASGKATAERAVYLDGESECKIIDYSFGWKSLWYDVYNYFQTRTNKGSKFLWLLADGWGCQVLFELRSGRSLGCILAKCSVDSCVRLLVKQDILIKVEPVFMSVVHIVRTIIYKQARTNLPMINYVWYQTFSIKFFISTLYYYLNVSFLRRVRSGHEAQIKSVRKTKFCLLSKVTNFSAWQTDFSFGAQV